MIADAGTASGAAGAASGPGTSVPLKSKPGTDRREMLGPWLWGARTDLLAFGGSALFALAAVAMGHATGLSRAPMPEWGYVVFILGVDVAHVYATLYRTYFDREELARRKRLYVALPIACFAIGLGLHLASAHLFWRVLAYLATFHFVRQQVGWVAIYRVRAGHGRIDKLFDDAAVYASTIVPLFVWHASLPRQFAWFVQGDFVSLAKLAPAIPMLKLAYGGVLFAWAARQALVTARERRLQIGKWLLVVTTALCWWVGIAATDDDFDFTVTNVLIHGVPYFVLLFRYGLARGEERPDLVASRIVAAGAVAFLGVLVGIAFLEEMLWDRLYWHDRAWLFGSSVAALPPTALAVVAALLAAPQATHYAIDAFLWRRRDVTAAQSKALGFR